MGKVVFRRLKNTGIAFLLVVISTIMLLLGWTTICGLFVTPPWLKNANTNTVGPLERGFPCGQTLDMCLTDNEAVILIQTIRENTLQMLKTAYSTEPFSILCLRSPGGLVRVVPSIGRWLREHNISTCVAETYHLLKPSDNKYKHISGQCGSACPLLLALGDIRIGVGKLPELKVHDSTTTVSFCFKDFRLELDCIDPFRNFIMRFFSEGNKDYFEFYLYSQTHPGLGSLYQLSINDIERFNIFTEHHYRERN